MTDNPFRAAGTFSGPTYIARAADGLLLTAIKRNTRVPFICAARQSGKSSLLIRVKNSLDAAEYRSAFVDLSPISTDDYEAFWFRMLEEVATSSDLDSRCINPKRPELTLLDWLNTSRTRLVVFVDEIDALLDAPFRELFFSKIRSLFNKRAQDPSYSLLTFVLAGAAHPAQLITDRLRSPFNVGVEIRLDALTLQHIQLLTASLASSGAVVDTSIANVVHSITGGSVYLSQLLFEQLWSVGEKKLNLGVSDAETIVDAIVDGSRTEIHFLHIFETISRSGSLSDAIYRLCNGLDVEPSVAQDLRVTGISDGTTPFGNPIYHRVFGTGGPLDLTAHFSGERSQHRLYSQLVDSRTFTPIEPESHRAMRLATQSKVEQASPPHNLPPRHAHFVGRESALASLDAQLQSAGRAGIAPGAIFGLGGVGKTTLALEYAHRFMAEYPGGVWWVRAEGDPAVALVSLATKLRAFAPNPVREMLERVPDIAPPAAIAEAVKLALQQCGAPTLLVLDNVDNASWRDHLPSGAVHVLITTRDRTVMPAAKHVALEGLTLDEARALADDHGGVTSDDNEADARDQVLLNVLGLLPVAVEVAARAVSRWHLSWSAYEKEVAARPLDVLDADDVRGSYPRGVFAALDLSITRCGEDTPARRLLEGAAVFAPEQVPREWAASAAGIDDDLSVRRALAALEALALVKTDAAGELLTMHRLLHRRVRELAARESTAEAWSATRRRGLACTAQWMDSTVDVTRIAAVEVRRAHVEELLSNSNDLDAQTWSKLADRFARHLRHRAEYKEAQGILEHRLRVDETAFGPKHPEVSTDLSALAAVLQDLGDAAMARSLLERSLHIVEAALGPDHPNVAIHLSNLALVLRDLGDASGASSLLERALRIDEAALGADHPNVAIRLSNLATMLLVLGDASRARSLLERALWIDLTALGSDHPNVAIRLSNLAAVLQDLGDAAMARSLLERSLHIVEAALGPDHPNVAIRLSNLALVLRDLGDASGASSLLERALRIDEAALGADHPNVAIRLSNLATVLLVLGDASRARSLLERALRIDEAALGRVHPKVATDLSNLALVLRDLGDLVGARLLLERAFYIDEEMLGPDHPNVAIRLSNLATVLQDLGNTDMARSVWERALRIDEAAVGLEHPNSRTLRRSLETE